MESITRKQDSKRILIFLAVTFLLTWGYCLLILYPVLGGESLSGVPSLKAQLMTAAVMFFPALGVLVTRLVTREGMGHAWLKLNLKSNLGYYLLAWFGPSLLTIMGTGLYFLVFGGDLDPGCGYLNDILVASGADMSSLPIPLGLLMLVQGVQSIVLAPILNFVVCFGEEWGWRGYLLPKLSKKLPMLPTLLISGVIWGVWHAPLTAVGHNYGTDYPGFPYTGILMMCLFCIVLGVFFSFVTLKTGSCIPAVLAHGAVNGFAAMGLYFTSDGGNPFVGPAPMGIIGMLPFVIAAIWMGNRLCKTK
ncbi:MAG: CPBP family intramembrane metalloprotease [Clostridia bacterium]|nr:CPBP family intramembrane metalloprotease [Clostridia bacterium]